MPITYRKVEGKKKTITEHWRSIKHIEAYAELDKVLVVLGQYEATLSSMVNKKKRAAFESLIGQIKGQLQRCILENWDDLDNAPIAPGQTPWQTNEVQE
jgi:hypothetical protein